VAPAVGAETTPRPWVANRRVLDGDPLRWMTKMESITGIVAAMGQQGLPVIGIRAQARLGSGEVVESPIMRWIDVTAAVEEPVS
jgi:hypothetical protein